MKLVDAELEQVLWVAGSTAALIMPGLVLAYRKWLVERRLDDIRTNLWRTEAIRKYVELFTTEDPDHPSEDFRRKVLKRIEKKRKAKKNSIDAQNGLEALVPEELFSEFAREEFLSVHSWRNYFVSLLPLSIVVTSVVFVCFAWVGGRVGAGHRGSIAALPDSVVLALAGAYVWSVYELLGRFRSKDLTPDDLIEITLRLLAAVPIGYACSLLVMDQAKDAIAFASAAFPLRDVRLFLRQRTLKKLDQSVVGETRGTAGHIAVMIDGLSDDTISRLEELHVSSYMDLAYVNPIRLMARTGFSLRHILAWIDQALLAVYAPNLKKKLTSVGLPCALDVREFYGEYCYDRANNKPRAWKTDATVLQLAKAAGVEIEFIREIFKRVDEDPHVQLLALIWYPDDDEESPGLVSRPAGGPEPPSDPSAGRGESLTHTGAG